MTRSSVFTGTILLASSTLFAAEPPLEYKNYAPVWSPDGSKIAFYSTRDGDWEVYTVDRDGSNLKRLTHSAGYDGEPSWSDDGTKIVFASDRDGDVDIYVMDADGSNVIQLTNSPQSEDDPSWSPDGNEILYRGQRDGSRFLFLMSTDGSRNRQLSPIVSQGRARWSLDGEEIAFIVDDGDRQAICRLSRDGETLGTISTRHEFPGNPSYSPTAGRIIYDAHVDGIAESGDGQWELWTIALDGSETNQITRNDTDDWGGHWSPDGEHVVFAGGGLSNVGYEIYISDVSGTNIRPLTSRNQ